MSQPHQLHHPPDPTTPPVIKWKFPKFGVPPNHRLFNGFFHYRPITTNYSWVPPILETPKWDVLSIHLAPNPTALLLRRGAGGMMWVCYAVMQKWPKASPRAGSMRTVGSSQAWTGLKMVSQIPPIMAQEYQWNQNSGPVDYQNIHTLWVYILLSKLASNLNTRLSMTEP